MDLPTRRAGANENKSGITTLRLRSDYSLPVHRCLFKVYLLYLLYMIFILDRFPVEIVYGSFTYIVLGRARVYLIYQRLS